MLLRRLIVAVIFVAGEVFGCSGLAWNPDDLVQNDVTHSANGRFAFIIRWYPHVADFKSERAEKIFEHSAGTPPANTVTVALYDAAHKRIAEFAIERGVIRDVLVADSGRHVVVVHGLGGFCGAHAIDSDPFLTIYRADGFRVGTLTAGDIFYPHDIERLSSSAVTWELRAESEERDVVVLKVMEKELRVDVNTAVLLDPKRPFHPLPRTYATVAGGGARYETPTCADDVVHVESQQLIARAVHSPLPAYPPVALKARIGGTVTVEVIVSESGDVLCARSTSLPFGASAAAVEAARQWRFKRSATKVAGEIAFHFEQ